MIVLGDFGQGPDSSDYDILRKEKFHHLIPAHTFTNISTKNPQGSKTLDNIWISKSLKKVFTGKAHVLFRNRERVACLSWQFTIVWFELESGVTFPPLRAFMRLLFRWLYNYHSHRATFKSEGVLKTN